MNSKICVLLALVVLCTICEVGFCRYDIVTIKKVGGVLDSIGFQNSAKFESLGRFAVDEYNKREDDRFLQNALLVFARVLKVKEQVVAGKLYHLTLMAIDANRKKIYEAKVWVKPWVNFKQLQEFKHAKDSSQLAAVDLGIIQGL